ncbi:MAG: amidohydrolase [Proteobacteria bacterium]|nr:amidohydrolase [Pseudomonadota bacterium]
MRPISADSHVVEGPGGFAGLADRFGDEAPRVIHTDGEGDRIVVPARKDPGVNVGFMALAATRLDRPEPIHRKEGHKPGVGTIEDPEVQAYVTGGYAAMRPGLTDGSRRGEDQDVDGLDAEFLYPGYFSMFSFRNAELLTALQKNYNDWLHDHCSASGGRLYGLAALPVQDPEAAVVELERVVELGYRGAILPSNAPKGRRYCDAEYDPLWSRAQEANLPLSFHVGCFSHVPSHVREAAKRDSLAAYAGAASLIHETLIELICRGVCARFPDLQFVVAEFNAGWLAHWLDRLAQGWQREYGKNPSGPKFQPVDEIWQRQFYATIEDDQPALRTRDMIGEDRLMWGSDYPHTDSTWPCSSDVLKEMFRGYPDEARQRITRDNVVQLYGL